MCNAVSFFPFIYKHPHNTNIVPAVNLIMGPKVGVMMTLLLHAELREAVKLAKVTQLGRGRTRNGSHAEWVQSLRYQQVRLKGSCS